MSKLSKVQIENFRKHNERQKAKREAKRNKTCAWCSVSFTDTSKRLSQKTCSSKCARQWGVAKRKENGTYKRTKDQNKKMVVSLQKARREGRWKISEEKKKKLSKQLKERWESGKMINDSRATCLERYGVEHWTQTEEWRKRASQIHKGKLVSLETRKKMSINAKRQTHRFSRCHGGLREDLGIYFRSSWEANYARYMNHVGITWEYESDTFELSTGMTYTPDFKIGAKEYVEIKGWLTTEAKEKLATFKKEFSDITIRLIQRKEYRELYKTYSKIIPFWENIRT